MKGFLLPIPFLLVVALIVYAQGTFSAFTLWNCLPVVAAFAALSVGLRLQGPVAAAAITFSSVAAFLPALFHLAWLFDWGSAATGSSTASLAFIFIPIWSFVFAAATAAVAWGIAR